MLIIIYHSGNKISTHVTPDMLSGYVWNCHLFWSSFFKSEQNAYPCSVQSGVVMGRPIITPCCMLHLQAWNLDHSFNSMMTSSNGNIFRVTGHLCEEFTGDRWIPRTKASDAELWCFLWFAWINGWVNNREAGDLRCHRHHHDVTVIHKNISSLSHPGELGVFIVFLRKWAVL